MKADTTFVRKDNQIARLAKGTHTHTHTYSSRQKTVPATKKDRSEMKTSHQAIVTV